MAEQLSTAVEKVELEAFTKIKAIQRPEKYEGFPVLVRVHGPRSAPRADVDLVAVLDISGSMRGERILRLKQAMEFIIDNLGPKDRLSVVAFNHMVHPLTGLSEMSDKGRTDARDHVGNLKADGGNDMGAALEMAASILKNRGVEESKNRAGCIIFLSDGEDDVIYRQDISPEFRAQTFGLGADHDPKVLHYIADNTSGIYSFINKDIEKIKDAFALSIGGLMSVTAMDIHINLQAPEGVSILSIESGGYENQVNPDKCSGSIEIDNLYAGEEKNFIVYLRVPEGKKPPFFGLLSLFGNTDMKLLTVSGKYKNPKISGEDIQLDKSDVFVARPEKLSKEDTEISPEVAAELVRLRLAKDIRDMSPTERTPTADDFQRMWSNIKNSEDGKAASSEGLSDLEKDIREMQSGITNPNEHKRSGLPYMLSWLTSHKWQRATTKGSPSNAGAFQTRAMKKMLNKVANPQQEDITDDPEPGSKQGRNEANKLCTWDRWDRVVKNARNNPSSCVAILAIVVLLVYFGMHWLGPAQAQPSSESAVVGAGTTTQVVKQTTVTTTTTVVVTEQDGAGKEAATSVDKAQDERSDQETRPSVDVEKVHLQLSRWSKMEQDLPLMFEKVEDPELTTFFQDASVEVINRAMHQYLYLAVVHASALGRRYTSIPEDVGSTISMLERTVEMLEVEKRELSVKIEVLVREKEEAIENANTMCAVKENEEALERANTRIAELERQLQDKKAFAESLLSEVANQDAHLKTCGERIDMLEAKVRELESPVDAN